MRAFLGLVNFCWRCILDVGVYIKLISPLASADAPREFARTPAQEEAFTTLKAALAAAPTISRQLYGRMFQMYVTIIQDCVSAVLTQYQGDRCPVAYFSVRLDAVVQGYPPCTDFTRTACSRCCSFQSYPAPAGGSIHHSLCCSPA